MDCEKEEAKAWKLYYLAKMWMGWIILLKDKDSLFGRKKNQNSNTYSLQEACGKSNDTKWQNEDKEMRKLPWVEIISDK